MPDPKPPSVSPWESRAEAETRATPTSVGSPAKAGTDARRHSRMTGARIGLQVHAEGQEELARRRGVRHQDGAGGVVGREHAVVEVRGVTTVGQVGDIERQLGALQAAESAEVVDKSGGQGVLGVEALSGGLGRASRAGE